MIFAMAVFGTIAVFVRNIPLPSGELALYRAVLAVVVIGIYMLATKKKLRFEEIKAELPLLFVSGAAIGINWILLFRAYAYTTVSVATISYYFAPIIVTVACPILFGERLTKKQIFCFAMSTIGLLMIVGVGNTGGANNLLGIAFGLGAAVFYASVVLLNKFIKNVTGLDRTLLQFLAVILVLLPYVGATTGFNLMSLNLRAVLCLLVVGILHTGIAYFLYFSALKDLRGQEAAILSYIDPLVAVLVSVSILGERMLPLQLLGGAIILGFTFWNEKNSAGN